MFQYRINRRPFRLQSKDRKIDDVHKIIVYTHPKLGSTLKDSLKGSNENIWIPIINTRFIILANNKNNFLATQVT